MEIDLKTNLDKNRGQRREEGKNFATFVSVPIRSKNCCCWVGSRFLSQSFFINTSKDPHSQPVRKAELSKSLSFQQEDKERET